jgi:short-subunit dehydrogenase
MQLNGARILLTGATGGLGEELARQFAAAGARMLLAGRDPARLAVARDALPGPHAVIRAELTQPEGIAATVHAAREFGVNVLVNNAGIGSFGMFEQQDWPDVEQILATNLQAPMRLTHAMLPMLRSRAQAAIISIGSTFGSLPFPGFAAYSAAKSGLRGFSQALRRELSDSSVAVIHLAPRAIDTPMNSAEVNELNRALGNSSAPAGRRRPAGAVGARVRAGGASLRLSRKDFRLAERHRAFADRPGARRQAAPHQAAFPLTLI